MTRWELSELVKDTCSHEQRRNDHNADRVFDHHLELCSNSASLESSIRTTLHYTIEWMHTEFEFDEIIKDMIAASASIDKHRICVHYSSVVASIAKFGCHFVRLEKNLLTLGQYWNPFLL
jgi:hypothetical protein